jgi:hypothetical protein
VQQVEGGDTGGIAATRVREVGCQQVPVIACRGLHLMLNPTGNALASVFAAALICCRCFEFKPCLHPRALADRLHSSHVIILFRE